MCLSRLFVLFANNKPDNYANATNNARCVVNCKHSRHAAVKCWPWPLPVSATRRCALKSAAFKYTKPKYAIWDAAQECRTLTVNHRMERLCVLIKLLGM